MAFRQPKKGRPHPKGGRDSLAIPWLSAATEETEGTLRTLAAEINRRHDASSAPVSLSEKQTTSLAKQFKNSEMGRGKASKFLLSLAKALSIPCPDGAVEVAEMKSWHRAAEKFFMAERHINDLGRGRIYINDVKELNTLNKIIHAMSRDGHINSTNLKHVRIIKDSIDDYLKTPRKSGYAGGFNFDLEVDLGKDRTGHYEVQIMPRAYKETYEHSHHLYDMIRILQEIPEAFRSAEENIVMDALILANASLFNEQAERTGFIRYRTKPYSLMTKGQMDFSFEILDRLRTAIENLPVSKAAHKARSQGTHAWKEETMDALTYAKTSLLNVFMGSQKNRAEASKPDKDHS